MSATLSAVTQLNPKEQRFATYLDEYGYSWKHEPDYQAELKLAERLATTPDFLIERWRRPRRGGSAAVRDDDASGPVVEHGACGSGGP